MATVAIGEASRQDDNNNEAGNNASDDDNGENDGEDPDIDLELKKSESLLVLGERLHSEGRESKLVKALKKKVKKDRNMQWEKVPQNPGAIIVLWVA